MNKINLHLCRRQIALPLRQFRIATGWRKLSNLTPNFGGIHSTFSIPEPGTFYIFNLKIRNELLTKQTPILIVFRKTFGRLYKSE